jgi:hypothetical protein
VQSARVVQGTDSSTRLIPALSLRLVAFLMAWVTLKMATFYYQVINLIKAN